MRRAALVTGGTRGIGAAISTRLAADGVDVVAAFRGDATAADQLLKATAGVPGAVSLARGDIGKPDMCRHLVATVLERHGRLDYLVSNAGLLVEAKPADTTEELWQQAMAVNLSGSWYLAQSALVPMTEQRFGRTVNISSVTAIMGSPVEAAYGAAKAGLLGLTRSLARATARKGITVNCVIPGVFETDMTNAMDPADQQAIRAMIPVGRRGDPEELAHAVAFLLDDRAAYVTGAVITVDGGLSMGR